LTASGYRTSKTKWMSLPRLPPAGDCFGLGFDTGEKIARPTQPAVLATQCLSYIVGTLQAQLEDEKGYNHNE
jgi:hypothetical protein